MMCLATREMAAVFLPKCQIHHYSRMENSISIQGAPTPNGHRVTTSLALRLVNVCIAFIALIVSGSADILFPLFASMGWFVSSIVLIFSARKEICHE
nr:MAG TPA: hypothetical protein [Caudoviricetes sp.]